MLTKRRDRILRPSPFWLKVASSAYIIAFTFYELASAANEYVISFGEFKRIIAVRIILIAFIISEGFNVLIEEIP